MHATLRIFAAALVVLFLRTSAVLAQTPHPETIVPALYSSTPMTRNAGVFFSAAVLSTSAVDRGLRALWLDRVRPDAPSARITRITRFALFDMPVVVYATGLNHEFGHLTRTDERGYQRTFRIHGGPWSTSPFELLGARPVFSDLGSQSGGVEASRRMRDFAIELLLDVRRVSPGHALLVIDGALDLPIYASRNLRASEFARYGPDAVPLGDAAQFVRILSERRGVALDEVRAHVRARSMINFVDFSVWSLGYGLVRNHLWSGEHTVPVRWLRAGSISLMPAARYEWTANGPEYHVTSGYRVSKVSGAAYVRWTDSLADDRLIGVGYSMKWPAVRGLSPAARLDLWSQHQAGAGVHAAVTGTLANWPSRRARLTVTAGAKSHGYLPAFPLTSGAYIDAGLVFRPW